VSGGERERARGEGFEKASFTVAVSEKRRRPVCGKPIYSMKKYPSHPTLAGHV
jgi:hypothetical protein